MLMLELSLQVLPFLAIIKPSKVYLPFLVVSMSYCKIELKKTNLSLQVLIKHHITFKMSDFSYVEMSAFFDINR